ncbi:polysaccharide deacetylase family protein [Streptomyces sp. IBSBF 3136]|uniref:polysaccharide deacetylase family protein n=1 Tax=Streptomyces sp. IBSBF 3136 TaxID=2903524 RepID=UPI002FDC5DF6
MSRRLLMVAAGLFTVRWKVVPGPAAALAEPVSQRLAAPADGDGVRALFGSENRDFHTGERVVAVTFNAAWNDAGLDRVLGELTRRHTPAAFFLTGEFADRHPEAVKRIAAAGHGLGNQERPPQRRPPKELPCGRAPSGAPGPTPILGTNEAPAAFSVPMSSGWR